MAHTLEKRVEFFNKELQSLLGKWDLALGAVAFLNSNGTIGARPQLFDANEVKKAQEDNKKKEEVSTLEKA